MKNMQGSDEVDQDAPIEIVDAPVDATQGSDDLNQETAPEMALAPDVVAHESAPLAKADPRLLRGIVRRRQRNRRKRIALLVMLCLLFVLLVPAAISVASALQDYSQLKGLGTSAVHHLLLAKDDLLPSKSSASGGSSCGTTTPTPSPTASATVSLSSLPSASQVQRAHDEFAMAQRDFQQLLARLDRPDWILSVGGRVQSISLKLSSVRSLALAGSDVSTIGLEATSAALPILTRLHSASGVGNEELIQPSDITAIQHVADDSLRLLGDIQAQVKQVNLAILPICAAQKAEYTKLVGELPRAITMLQRGEQFITPLGWALGVGQSRTFLVQTLDRAELRPSGGFTGDYGLLSVQNGKIGPFTLTDVDRIDYNTGYSWTAGRRAPATYSWWPFSNWGLRDANLSGDYPTNAKMVMDVFHNEGGPTIDGVIEISPVAIEHVLKVTGPLAVPQYGETITADNLEARLHYYQQDPAGIAKEQALSPNDTTTSVRKRFTSLVGRLLEARVRHLPLDQMKPLARQVLLDLQAKDIQIYVNNKQLEDLLTKHHADGAIDTTSGVDSFYLLQANVSVAKSSSYVNVIEHDDITLDAQGGATHNLTVTMKYNPTGDVYGYSTYSDYVRLYTPAGATLLSADGFDNGTPLCWTPPPNHPDAKKPDQFKTVPDCTADPYPNGELSCPPGYYGPGNKAPSLTTGSDGSTPWVLDTVGEPTSTTSDISGRTMWGGYVFIPSFCTATLTLSWHVPNVAAPSGVVPWSAAPYTIIVQRQSGTFYEAQVTIHPAAQVAAQSETVAHFDATVSENLFFRLGASAPGTYAPVLG